MDLTSKSFEVVMGKSPYKYFRDQNDIYGMLVKDIEQSPDDIDFSSYHTGRDWDAVCIFNSNDINKTKEIIGPKFDSRYFNEIIKTKKVNLLAFMDDKDLSFQIYFPKEKADFPFSSGKCFPKQMARFFRDRATSERLFYPELKTK